VIATISGLIAASKNTRDATSKKLNKAGKILIFFMFVSFAINIISKNNEIRKATETANRQNERADSLVKELKNIKDSISKSMYKLDSIKIESESTLGTLQNTSDQLTDLNDKSQFTVASLINTEKSLSENNKRQSQILKSSEKNDIQLERNLTPLFPLNIKIELEIPSEIEYLPFIKEFLGEYRAAHPQDKYFSISNSLFNDNKKYESFYNFFRKFASVEMYILNKNKNNDTDLIFKFYYDSLNNIASHIFETDSSIICSYTYFMLDESSITKFKKYDNNTIKSVRDLAGESLVMIVKGGAFFNNLRLDF